MMPTASPLTPALPADVLAFAAEWELTSHLAAVVAMTRRIFQGAPLGVSVGRDAEDPDHTYLALDVQVGEWGAEELLNAQRTWSRELVALCPPERVVRFVLGWQ